MPVTTGASWNRSLLAEIGAATALELRSAGGDQGKAPSNNGSPARSSNGSTWRYAGVLARVLARVLGTAPRCSGRAAAQTKPPCPLCTSPTDPL